MPAPKNLPSDKDFIVDRITVAENCWEWGGAKTAEGYAHFRRGVNTPTRQAPIRYAHRVVYEWFVGPIPPGLQIDHLCRNRGCVRPSHLEAVTQIVNIRRGLSGAGNRSKTHCMHGHEFSTLNTKVLERGWRRCMACEHIRNREHYLTNRSVVIARSAARRIRLQQETAHA